MSFSLRRFRFVLYCSLFSPCLFQFYHKRLIVSKSVRLKLSVLAGDDFTSFTTGRTLTQVKPFPVIGNNSLISCSDRSASYVTNETLMHMICACMQLVEQTSAQASVKHSLYLAIGNRKKTLFVFREPQE